MPKGKSSSKKSASAQAIKGGGSGKMHKFGGAAAQKPGGTAVTSVSGKGASFPEGGGSGKMHNFSGVKAQKPGTTAQQSGGGKGYAK